MKIKKGDIVRLRKCDLNECSPFFIRNFEYGVDYTVEEVGAGCLRIKGSNCGYLDARRFKKAKTIKKRDVVRLKKNLDYDKHKLCVERGVVGGCLYTVNGVLHDGAITLMECPKSFNPKWFKVVKLGRKGGIK